MFNTSSPRTPASGPRQIAILVYPGVQSLDFTGPLEVFAGAQRLIERTGRSERGYEITLVSTDGKPLQTSSGLTVTPHASLAAAPEAIDTLIVAGGYGRKQAAVDPVLLDWIAVTSATARRTASVCTGAFLLAAAGLLDGRRATTHWASAGELAARYPAVSVDPEPIFTCDGSIWTSAGVTAGMDLALALVEEDLDRDAALTIAQEPAREPLREVQRHVIEHPAEDLSVEALAERACMSPRNFARAFRAEAGVTPARYVEQVRLEAARRRLEDTGEPIAAVATTCGFGTAETMRRAFLRALEVGPAEYRRRFHSQAKETVQ
jgi:transcriptional regulator GlxA family with amidase domain